MVLWVVGSILHGMDPLSYFSFQPVLHDRCNQGRGMYYPVCGMVHIKEPLLLIGKSSPCGGSGFPLSLFDWSLFFFFFFLLLLVCVFFCCVFGVFFLVCLFFCCCCLFCFVFFGEGGSRLLMLHIYLSPVNITKRYLRLFQGLCSRRWVSHTECCSIWLLMLNVSRHRAK